MNYTEETALFACAGDTLLGILTKPETPADTGVIVLVGGPHYRIGSHRQFVLLSRGMAAAGYAALRFDYRGVGDSTGELHTFENVNEDIAVAISALQMAAPNVQHVAFWGLWMVRRPPCCIATPRKTHASKVCACLTHGCAPRPAWLKPRSSTTTPSSWGKKEF